MLLESISLVNGALLLFENCQKIGKGFTLFEDYQNIKEASSLFENYQDIEKIVNNFLKEGDSMFLFRLHKYWKMVCFLCGVACLIIGITISPYIRAFVGLLKVAKEEVDKKLTHNPEENEGSDREDSLASVTEGCPEIAPVKLYIKK